ncbi:MAG TPA: type II toxin-antitoxin system VapC family toxin [Thermoanaerobaculia bacterium]|nr:type II toxin-antitoxin system VapC family toxin [Thermoanaerobaculia bacterium]
MNVVVDASVVIKWVFPESAQEEHTAEALQLLEDIKAGRAFPRQPLHWLTEVAAVVTRLHPEIAEPVIDLLSAMEFPVVDDIAVLKKASRLSMDLNHHLFDTLYHAVALETGATLVSADDVYCRKARRLGKLIRLASWKGVQPAETVES